MTDQGGDHGQEAPPPSSRLRRQFRDRPIVAWGLVAIGVGLLAAVVVIAVVHGTSEPKDTPITCTVYEQSSTLRLTIHSMVTKKEAAQGCGHSTQGLSSAAAFFVVGTPPIPEEEPQEICALTSPDQPTTMIVEEVPGVLSKGERICGALAGEGWSQALDAPEIGPGQREYVEAVEAVEAEQRRETEIEEGEREEREQAIYACEEKAEAAEERELEAIERETEERVAAAPESQEYEIEEEGYEREEEAYKRELEAAEACESEAEAETGETEYR